MQSGGNISVTVAGATVASTADFTYIPTDVVYVALQFNIPEQGKIWINGELTDLPDCNIINSLFVSGDDIYAAGMKRTSGGTFIGKYWKNGSATDFTDGAYYAQIASIYVAGNDVYTTGYSADAGSNGQNFARLWKNGNPETLQNAVFTDGSSFSYAEGVHVFGNNVYVAGTIYQQGSPSKATLWTNGVPATLNGNVSANAYANAVFVSNSGDVYVAGSEFDGNWRAVYWKNGEQRHFLTAGAHEVSVYAITVVGSDVHAAGFESNGTRNVAKYWKNNQTFELTDGVNHAWVYSICVSGEDVYIAGHDNFNARLWKHGKNGIELIDLPSGNTQATSVYVRQE
jgi:hypothetical protein